MRLVALGSPIAVVRLATNSPKTTMLALPHRSARPAKSDESAPTTLEMTTTVR